MKFFFAMDEIESLGSDEVKTILDGDSKGEYVLLDVRRLEEYEIAHLPGAMLMPLDELESKRGELYGELYRGKRILVYCRSGRRSVAAAIELRGMGFEYISVLRGGLNDWKYETLSGQPELNPRMVIEAADIRDVLVIALKLEKGAHDFYLKARDEAVSEAARTIFQQLGEVELSHIRRLFLRLTGKLSEGISLSYIDQYLMQFDRDAAYGGIEISEALIETGGELSDEMEALEMAIENEYKTNDFYKRAAPLVDDEDVRELLHELAQDERSHANALLNRLAQVVKAGE